MGITDNGGFQRELTESQRRKRDFQRHVIQSVEVVSLQTMSRIKTIMPFRTGRARATWGMYTPDLLMQSLIVATSERATWLGQGKLDPREAIWKVQAGGLKIVQGARLKPYNYIEDLNAGSSTQAPAMFLDVTEEQAADNLTKRIDQQAGDAV